MTLAPDPGYIGNGADVGSRTHEYRTRKRIYKRQCRGAILGVGFIALAMVALIGIPNNNSKTKNAIQRRRDAGK